MVRADAEGSSGVLTGRIQRKSRVKVMTPRKTWNFVAAFLFAAVLSSAVLAKDTPKERTQPRSASAMPFAPSEQLVYEGEFSKLLLRGIDVAELRFKAS